MPARDLIEIPDVSLFETEARYHATLLHELVHWSGAAQRLNRELMMLEMERRALRSDA